LDYSQPIFFKFGNDSLYLSQQFLSLEKDACLKKRDEIHMLDLCCGSGVIGLEILSSLDNFNLLAVDILKEYEEHFHINVKMLNLEKSNPKFLVNSCKEMQQVEYFNRYDYIVSNPPYYDPSKGRMPTDEHKKIAKFFVKDGFSEFLRTVHYCLRDDGIFWFLRTSKDNNDVVNQRLLCSLFKETHVFKEKGFELLRLVKLNKD
jgi:tRNA1Val (adenine37-N6)-methyltransferase